jgi:hypothetical protein
MAAPAPAPFRESRLMGVKVLKVDLLRLEGGIREP